MLTLGKLLIQTPKDLSDTESRHGNGIREITTGGRDGSDNGNRTLSTRVT